MKHLIDTDIDTKVSRDTYRRYKYFDTAHLWLSVMTEPMHCSTRHTGTACINSDLSFQGVVLKACPWNSICADTGLGSPCLHT